MAAKQQPDPKIVFEASLPDIMSAISLPGYEDAGARIKLDVPASDIGEVLKLKLIGSGKPLRVTIEVLNPKATNTSALRKRLEAVSRMEDDDALSEDN